MQTTGLASFNMAQSNIPLALHRGSPISVNQQMKWHSSSHLQYSNLGQRHLKSASRGDSLRHGVGRVLARKRSPRLEARHGKRLAELGPLVVGPALAPDAALHRTVLEKAERSLAQLPELDARHKDNGEAHGQRPFPRDTRVLEERCVEKGNVHDREHGQTTQDDGPEQELVGVEVLEDGKRAVVVGVEPEHGPPQALKLPRRDENQPSQLGKRGSSRPEDGDAGFGKVGVAVKAQVAVVGAVDDDDKGAHGADAHDDAVHDHVDNDLVGEDAALLVLRRLAHHVRRRLLAAQAKGRKRRRHHVDPDDLQRRHGEDGEASPVHEAEPGNQENDLADVGGEQVQHKLLDIVKHAATLADGGHDGVELVVGEHNLGRRLCHVRARPHGDAHVSPRQRGRIVDAVARHGHEGASAA
ncbi:hypothetical protein G6O67_004578 [Ophiocordyceps sinensis]|uniref:Uncharacterized protein n=1 Tax=Ophiocordyceps sinensis TaxID=72228 RepID=A0A8H4PPQ1_9HYPO|nr:hypothetical protein G6O67_004578 [Ophiocordyceps sinensis]